jgi:molybdopterin-guanine dinucleotide biosynthesis protein A
MGGQDKGWLNDDRGVPLIQRVIDALPSTLARVVISANRSQDRYRRLATEVLEDGYPGNQGPLAGILAALQAIPEPYLLVLPCDSAYPPTDLLARLARAWDPETRIAAAHDGERLQPLFSLWRATERDPLAAYLAAGERRVDRYLARRGAVEVNFADNRSAFANLNTVADYQRWKGQVPE